MYSENFDFTKAYVQEEFSKIRNLSHVKKTLLTCQVLENGIVLPECADGKAGGVATQTGVFVSTSSFSTRSERQQSEVNALNVKYCSDIAIFIGCIYSVWGHNFIENISRLWFLNTEDGKRLVQEGAKIVYINHLNASMSDSFRHILQMLDISADVWNEVKEATRYRKVILPDPTFDRTLFSVFNNRHLDLIDRIKAHANEGVKVEKLYFTRTSIATNYLREFGEYLLEDIFRRMGYLIVSPEHLPFEEQLALLQSCKYFAATEGSIAHNAVFCKPGTHVTVLRKADYFNTYQLALNQLRGLDVTNVDAHHSVPPYSGAIWTGPFYMCITRELLQFVGFNQLYLPYWLRLSYWWYVIRRNPFVKKNLANRRFVHIIEQSLYVRRFGYVPDRIFRHLSQRLRIALIERGRYLISFQNKRYSADVLSLHSDFPILDCRAWSERLSRLIVFEPKLETMALAFCTHKIEVIKPVSFVADAPILICLQKNDLVRIKAFVEHHRSIGIGQFVIIDNGSTDGSLEWLVEQQDVFVLQVMHPYSSANRDAWINRVMAYFGDNRWYLVLDSDELLAYDDMEHHDIGQLIAHMERKGITRCRAMMLDMYAADGYFESGERSDFLRQCVYFDADTYTTAPWDYHVALSGGPRRRLFGTEATLTKYPLFRLADGELLYQAHAMFPLAKNLNTPCHLVIRHYKFLPGDKQKFERIAREGKYYGGSIEYKNYVKAMANGDVLHFVDVASVKYEDSASLRCISCYQPIDWK